MFKERLDGELISFAGTEVPGQPHQLRVLDGDSVSLELDDQRILVRNVTTVAPGRFKGNIYGFEPSGGLQYRELHMHQEIEFGEQQIQACRHP